MISCHEEAKDQEIKISRYHVYDITSNHDVMLPRVLEEASRLNKDVHQCKGVDNMKRR